jgi:hypothetical protein
MASLVREQEWTVVRERRKIGVVSLSSCVPASLVLPLTEEPLI